MESGGVFAALVFFRTSKCLPRFHPQLLPNLYHLGSTSRKELNGSSVGPIQEKLDSMAGEVAQVLDEQLQVTSSTTVKNN